MKKIKCLGIEFHITLPLIESIITFEGEANEKYKNNAAALALTLFNKMLLHRTLEERVNHLYKIIENVVCFYVRNIIRKNKKLRIGLLKSDFDKLGIILNDNTAMEYYELHYSFDCKYQLWGYAGESAVLVMPDIFGQMDKIILY